MPRLVLRNEEDVKDLVRGCTFLGTGGGGSPEHGVRVLMEALEKVGEIVIIDPSEVSDDELTVCTYLMGSIAPKTPEVLKKMEDLGLTKIIGFADHRLALAALELERYLNQDIDVIVPIELGGANTPAPISVAVMLGKKIVDGDYAGRAIPEIPQTTPYLYDKPITPIASVDSYGNTVIIKKTINYRLAEMIGKLVSVAAFGLVGQAGFPMSGKDMKEVVIPGTLTEAYNIGKAIREAREKGKDPVEAVVKVTNGWLLFKGKVTKKDWEDKEGYLWGINTIEGVDEFKGHEFKIFYKNENHVTWLDGKPYVTSPDIIEVVDMNTGEPITNTDIAEGNMVAVIGIKARPQFRSEKGLYILGPKHFGYDIEYRPIEEVVK